MPVASFHTESHPPHPLDRGRPSGFSGRPPSRGALPRTAPADASPHRACPAASGGKACLSIRKHDHFTPAREIKRHVRALGRNHPEGYNLHPCGRHNREKRRHRCEGEGAWWGEEFTLLSFSSRSITLLAVKPPSDPAEFCRSGDSRDPLTGEPSLERLRELPSEYVFAPFRRRPDCSTDKRSRVMVKPAQISQKASVVPPVGLARLTGSADALCGQVPA